MKMELKQNLNTGHRTRLKEKFIKSPESLNDYEILEMILFNANARKDTRNIAKELIQHFTSLKDVLDADIEELQDFNNIGFANAVSIKVVKEAFNRILKYDIQQNYIELNNLKKVEEYCKYTIGNVKNEIFKVLFLNNQLKLIKEENLGTGNIKEVKIYKNMLITKATHYGCGKIILVHNHPSGDPTPSLEDIKLTHEIHTLLKLVDMELIDHIIVSKNKTYSMAQNKILNQLENISLNHKHQNLIDKIKI